MPTLGTWNGVRVMCYREASTKRAHVHAFVGDEMVRVDVQTGKAYFSASEKRASAKAVRAAEAAVQAHLDECQAAWEKFKL